MDETSLFPGIWRNTVTDSLLGLTALNQEVMLFTFGNVVCQKKYLSNKGVRILSGGPSGFGPAFAGYVGTGMLTASVQGDKYTAPASRLILRAIRELNLKHTGGILVIIHASTGELLNFGLAVSRALNDGIRIKLIQVSDDVDNKEFSKVKRRGLTGVILVQKIAGAMSDLSFTLGKIFEFCLLVVKNIKSTIMCMKERSPQTKDLCICKKNLRPDEAELGKGMQCESGVRVIKIESVSDICNGLLDQLFNPNNPDRFVLGANREVVMLLNNLGGLTHMEELTLVKELINVAHSRELIIKRLYVGSFMTSETCYGVSLTIMNVFHTEVLPYLDAPCSAPAWRKFSQDYEISDENCVPGMLQRKDRLTPPIRGPQLTDRNANILGVAVQFACDALISCERQLNVIDSEDGDGDTGTRFKRAAEVILKRLKANKIILKYPFTFLEGLSKILETTIGGTIGCIYSILFEAAAKYFSELHDNYEVTAVTWLNALVAANAHLKKFGKMEFGDGTMYDPLKECADVIKAEFNMDKHFLIAFAEGVAAAEIIAARRVKGFTPDPGAHAVGIWMRAAYEACRIRCPMGGSSWYQNVQ